MQFYIISFLSFGLPTALTKLQAEFCCMAQEVCTFWSEFKHSLPSEHPFISVDICNRREFSAAVFSSGFSFVVRSFNSLETRMLCFNWAIVLSPSLSRYSLLLEQWCNQEACYSVT